MVGRGALRNAPSFFHSLFLLIYSFTGRSYFPKLYRSWTEAVVLNRGYPQYYPTTHIFRLQNPKNRKFWVLTRKAPITFFPHLLLLPFFFAAGILAIVTKTALSGSLFASASIATPDACPTPLNRDGTRDQNDNNKKCQGDIADSKAGDKLAFCVDGTSVHLVMGASNEGRPGIGFRVEPVSADKRPTEKNPYRSVSHVLCGNTRRDNGQVCRKKVRSVVCSALSRRCFLSIFRGDVSFLNLPFISSTISWMASQRPCTVD